MCCWEEIPPTSHPQAPDASLGQGSSHKCSHRTSHPCMLAGFGAKADIQHCTLVFQNIQITLEEINAKHKTSSLRLSPVEVLPAWTWLQCSSPIFKPGGGKARLSGGSALAWHAHRSQSAKINEIPKESFSLYFSISKLSSKPGVVADACHSSS